MRNNRLWELDALRGLSILAMVAVHTVYDVAMLYRLVSWRIPAPVLRLMGWGGQLFVVLSGVCATLGSRPVKRGVQVLSCGLLCTLVTLVLALAGWLANGAVIWFGVLHCLGLCMLLWGLFRRLGTPVLTALGSGLTLLGLMLEGVRVDFDWLAPLGLHSPVFQSGDYFPLLPGLGLFLLGAALGRRLYPTARSHVPASWGHHPVGAFLGGCGKLSLPIYLLHQPVLSGVFTLALASRQGW